MVHSAAYSPHTYFEYNTSNGYIQEDQQAIYCPLCGHEVDSHLRFCRTCGRALPSDLFLLQGKLGHTFSSTKVSPRRKTSECRESGYMSFDRSKRIIGVDRCCKQLFQFFLGLSLLLITMVSVAYFVSGKLLF